MEASNFHQDYFHQGHCEEKENKEKVLAEWEKFKFDTDSWKQEIPEGMNKSHLETATKWRLKRLISFKTAYSTVFPALANIMVVCLSMPVFNAWPERGCSSQKALQASIMHDVNGISINTCL